MRAFARSPTVGGFAILFYAVHPVAVRTTMWLSDRFDLMATASVFAARALFLHPTDTKLRLAGLCFLTLSARLSKETGFALLALVAVHFMFRRHAVSGAAAYFLKLDLPLIGACTGAAIVVRWTLLRGRGVPFPDEAISHTLFEGALLYARALTAASLGGFDLHSPFAVLTSVSALVAVIAVGVRAFVRSRAGKGASSKASA